jgi:hypothetical protein
LFIFALLTCECVGRVFNKNSPHTSGVKNELSAAVAVISFILLALRVGFPSLYAFARSGIKLQFGSLPRDYVILTDNEMTT